MIEGQQKVLRFQSDITYVMGGMGVIINSSRKCGRAILPYHSRKECSASRMLSEEGPRDFVDESCYRN